MSIDSLWDPGVQQAVFRLLLEATSRPGRIYELSPVLDDTPAFMAILATLVDKGATLHDGTRGLRQREHNILQAVPEEVGKANFILASGAQPPEFKPAIGSLESPETGATLILTVAALGQGEMHMSCTGPGIEDRHTFHVQGLHPGWIQARKKWNTWFPLGVDIYLVDATQVCALPRTTCIA